MKAFFFLFVSALNLVFAVGCSEDGSESSVPVNTETHRERERSGGKTGQSVYLLRVAPEYNKVELVHLAQGENHADFLYSPLKNELLSLTQFNAGPFIGCTEKDIAVDLRLYKLNAGGEFDPRSYQGLGPQPIPVEADAKYMARLKITLKKECLGAAFGFSVRSDPWTRDQQ